MLELRDIVKDYPSGDEVVRALKGITISFRDCEFVAILGQSGCGKTTMLNILGGLDRYTTGDLVINGRSTKGFEDKDWDTYRNHSIGFVFQSYNLIMHQTVLRNVELALTISGVSRRERVRRAQEALAKVGLSDQMGKKPTQLSGGQMQRVAIARAIVNDPDIILADEPTGALDTATSVQVMDILKDLSKDRLVIMVTHNPELAERYATRIVRLVDGQLQSDSDAFVPVDDGKPKIDYDAMTERERRREYKRQAKEERRQSGKGKRRMSFFTAMALSFNNLRTKKGRTILTAFAGSIGIIGIAAILSLSNGANEYIRSVEQDTLSSYPITLEGSTMDMTALMTAMSGSSSGSGSSGGTARSGDKAVAEDSDVPKFVGTRNVMTGMISKFTVNTTDNDLASFRAYMLDAASEGHEILELSNDIQYGYDTTLYIYVDSPDYGIVQVNPATVMTSLGVKQQKGTDSAADAATGLMESLSPLASEADVWDQLMDNAELLDGQYDILAGRMPQRFDEVVLITNKKGQVSDYMLYALGLRDQTELGDMMRDAYMGVELPVPKAQRIEFDAFVGMEFRLVLPTDFFSRNDDGTWTDRRGDEEYLAQIVADGVPITIVGIIRPNENAAITEVSGSIGYRADLTEYIVRAVNDSEIVRQQVDNPDVDVFTGVRFDNDGASGYTMADIQEYMQTLDGVTRALAQGRINQAMQQGMTESQIVAMFEAYVPAKTTSATYEGNLDILEVSDIESPSSIQIFAKDFESKERITQIIDGYNERAKEVGDDGRVIQYTDYVGLMMSSVRTVIDAISYILIAFVAISLIVSSIMIGIITYISVLERTKEIGILRAIGASKRDVTRVFNAETFVVGLISGLLGIGVTLLLIIPANVIIHNLTGVADMAQLPWIAAIILVVLSVILTLVGGMIPSRMAAKRDPVTALRNE